jgi:DNA polymerase
MSQTLRQHYLAALGITLWLPRPPAATLPAPVVLAQPPVAATDHLEPAVEASSVTAMAADEWLSPLTEDWELETAVEDTEDMLPSTANRAADIATLDWSALTASVQQCTACGLCTSRTQTVFGVGNRKADWLVIGEAPGADEDRQGEPFVGRAGKLLNPMLQAIGLDRDTVFIANILKCRPPDNRDPTPTEAESCRPFLERQIALIRPRMILAVGRIAAQNLLATDTQIGKLRGRIHPFGATRIPLVVTYHPAYLLRSPREKRKSWDDLRLARRALAAVQSASFKSS